MARETKAERLAQEAQEQAVYAEEQETTYLKRLMDTLQAAQAENFDVTIDNMTFVVRDRDDRDYDRYVLDLSYSDTAEEDLQTVVRLVEWKVDKRNEVVRQANVRANALSKLTAEERKLLNL